LILLYSDITKIVQSADEIPFYIPILFFKYVRVNFILMID